MREGWNTSALEPLLELVIDHRGKTPKKLGFANFSDSGVPVVSAIHIKGGRIVWGERERYVPEELFVKWMPTRLRKGDVLLTSEAPLGEVAQIANDDPVVLSQRLFALRGKNETLDNGYLAYYLRSERGQAELHRRATGTTVLGIRQSELRKITVAYPAFEEQRAIAGVLGALDDLIDTNQRLVDDLLAQITALHAHAVSDETELVPLMDVFNVEFGGAYKGIFFSHPGEGMPLLRIRDLKTFKSDTWTTEHLPNDVVVEPGDVLVGMDAEFRSTYWLGERSLMNQRVCRVSGKVCSRSFVREALVAPMAFIEGHKTGTTVAHLNKRDLQETKVLMPSTDRLAAFDRAAEPMRNAIVGLSQEIADLRRTRDELLPLLMSGVVSVGEVAG